MSDPSSPPPLAAEDVAERLARARLAFRMLELVHGRNVESTLDVIAALVARILQMAYTGSPQDCAGLGFAFVGKVFQYFENNPLKGLEITLAPHNDEIH